MRCHFLLPAAMFLLLWPCEIKAGRTWVWRWLTSAFACFCRLPAADFSNLVPPSSAGEFLLSAALVRRVLLFSWRLSTFSEFARADCSGRAQLEAGTCVGGNVTFSFLGDERGRGTSHGDNMSSQPCVLCLFCIHIYIFSSYIVLRYMWVWVCVYQNKACLGARGREAGGAGTLMEACGYEETRWWRPLQKTHQTSACTRATEEQQSLWGTVDADLLEVVWMVLCDTLFRADVPPPWSLKQRPLPTSILALGTFCRTRGCTLLAKRSGPSAATRLLLYFKQRRARAQESVPSARSLLFLCTHCRQKLSLSAEENYQRGPFADLPQGVSAFSHSLCAREPLCQWRECQSN